MAGSVSFAFSTLSLPLAFLKQGVNRSRWEKKGKTYLVFHISLFLTSFRVRNDIAPSRMIEHHLFSWLMQIRDMSHRFSEKSFVLFVARSAASRPKTSLTDRFARLAIPSWNSRGWLATSLCCESQWPRLIIEPHAYLLLLNLCLLIFARHEE